MKFIPRRQPFPVPCPGTAVRPGQSRTRTHRFASPQASKASRTCAAANSTASNAPDTPSFPLFALSESVRAQPTGNSTTSTVPEGWLGKTRMKPWWSLTMDFTMVSPRPVPPFLLEK